MRDVYRGATLNIAATAAEYSNAGLYFDRSARETEPFKVDIAWLPLTAPDPVDPGLRSFLCYTHRDTDWVINRASLNRRAWVMQERYLSRRMLHFTRQGIFWECHEAFVSETHPDQIPLERVDDPDWGTRGLELLMASYKRMGNSCVSSRVSRRNEALYRAWHTFVMWYSECALTFSGGHSRGLRWHCAKRIKVTPRRTRCWPVAITFHEGALLVCTWIPENSSAWAVVGPNVELDLLHL